MVEVLDFFVYVILYTTYSCINVSRLLTHPHSTSGREPSYWATWRRPRPTFLGRWEFTSLILIRVWLRIHTSPTEPDFPGKRAAVRFKFKIHLSSPALYKQMSHDFFPFIANNSKSSPCIDDVWDLDPKILAVVKISGVSGGQDVWKLFLMLPEPLFEDLSQMGPGIVILDFAHSIREEKSMDGTTWSFSIQIVSQELTSWSKPDYNTAPTDLLGRY